jgi:hypothetical protein
MSSAQPESGRPTADRWHGWLSVSIAVHVLTALIYPAAMSGLHFRLALAVVGAVRLIWTDFLLVAGRTKGKRILAFVNLALSLGWPYVERATNLQFLAWPYGGAGSGGA